MADIYLVWTPLQKIQSLKLNMPMVSHDFHMNIHVAKVPYLEGGFECINPWILTRVHPKCILVHLTLVDLYVESYICQCS